MDIGIQMARLSTDACEMVRVEFSLQLDFSEASIGDVEAVLNKIMQGDERSDELLQNTALLFGSYIGETIRSRYPSATWSPGSLTASAPPPSLSVGNIVVSPIAWCFKRLHYGAVASVVEKYLAFRNAASSPETSPKSG